MNIVDLSLIISCGSTVVAGMNGVGLFVMYRKYRYLARKSVVFAGDVVGHLTAHEDGSGEVTDPMGLIASTLDHMAELSVMTKMV